jgi:hypothetical protein
MMSDNVASVDGHIEIDSNVVERAIRPTALNPKELYGRANHGDVAGSGDTIFAGREDWRDLSGLPMIHLH